jgi:hypothetical protein
MKKEDFYSGQRVKIFDKDENCNVYGHVVEIGQKAIYIKWNDIPEPVEHLENEFSQIKDGTPNN